MTAGPRSFEQVVRRPESISERNRLVKANMGLVFPIAKRYLKYGLSLDDLKQEGAIGLIKAVERFDPDRGVKFSTYASLWIRAMITRAINKQGRLIRAPDNKVLDLSTLNQAQEECLRKSGYEPTPEELAECLDWETQTVERLLVGMREPFSLDQTLSSASNSDSRSDFTLLDVLPNENSVDPELAVIFNFQREKLANWLQKAGLDEREITLLFLIYGVGQKQKKTQREVAQVLGVSHTRVWQYKERALEKARAYAITSPSKSA